jgi:hypothetical protein
VAKYAESTTVDAARSRAEIERTLERYGAWGFAYAWEEERAMIAFRPHDRHIRFVLPLLDQHYRSFTHTPTGLKRTERSGSAGARWPW